jgi:6-phosphogluconolactonase (cycloisomerase 2 family)
VADIAVSPDGRNIYAVNESSNVVIAYGRDALTGRLSRLVGPSGCITGDTDVDPDDCVFARALEDAVAVAVSPDGRNVYAVSLLSNAIVAFARDRATGSLRQLSGAAGCTSASDAEDNSPPSEGCAKGVGLSNPSSIAFSPDGRNAYVVADHTLALFSRNPRTGALKQLAGRYGCVSYNGSGGRCTKGSGVSFLSSVVVSPEGRHVYTAAGSGGNPGDPHPTSNAIAVFARNVH